MRKVLFVCLGNICRSPMAEAIFKQKLKDQNLEGQFKVDSCGTADYHIGELPDERTIEIVEKHNIPIKHRGRQFEVKDFDRYDHILVMDESNKTNVIKQARNDSDIQKVVKIRSFEDEAIYQNDDVPDPYYGGKDGFLKVFLILDRCTNNFLKEHSTLSMS